MEPIIRVFGIEWHLLLAQAVNFAVVLFVFYRFLYKPILKVLDERRIKITEGMRKAEEADAHLTKASLERDQIVGSATRDAEALIADAREKAEVVGGEVVKRAEEKASQVLTEASLRAEEEKRRALKESEKEITKAALLAAEKLLKQKNA